MRTLAATAALAVAGTDELANAKASMAEMDRLRSELDKEAEDRRRLEAEIMALKSTHCAGPAVAGPKPHAPC